MPAAFQIYALESFPNETSFQTAEQLSLLTDSETNVEVSVTRVSRSAAIPNPVVIQYDAVHDFLFKLQYPGRARGKTFNEFITPYKFPVFVAEPDLRLGFRPILVRTKKNVGNDFIKRLNDKKPGFRAAPLLLDFNKLRPRLEFIKGAWFGAMKRPNLATTGMFGPHVDRSDEFKHAEASGELKNLIIELEVEDLTHTTMLGSDGAIMLYKPYQTYQDELDVILVALRGLLKGALTVVVRDPKS